VQRRLALGAKILLALFLPLWLYWFALFLGAVPDEDPPNVDVIVFWTAAKLGAGGDATIAYDPETFEASQVEAVGEHADNFPWIYPPVAFVFVLPLALLPYGAAFGAWLAATGAVLFSALRRLAQSGSVLWLGLAFPATLFNLIIGQAGLLTAGIFAWTMLLLPSRPLAAGAVLGVLAMKPQFLPMVLLALFAGRQVKALAATLASASALVLISLLGFGFGPWQEFISRLTDSADLFYDGRLPVAKMQSVTAMMFVLDAPELAANALQAVATLGAAAFVVWLWRRDVTFEFKAAGVGLASLLATPWVYHYDLTTMGVAMVFFANGAAASRWLPWERPLLVFAWFAPLLTVVLGLSLSFTIGAPILLLLAALVARRVRAEAKVSQVRAVPLAAAA
jgi:hypothetical protein